jgi:hypothetical protein
MKEASLHSTGRNLIENDSVVISSNNVIEVTVANPVNFKTTAPDINRSEVCPFLARICYAINDTNIYEKPADIPKDREIILYLWYGLSEVG